MKKACILLFITFLFFANSTAAAKPSKIKCKKPIYFFENANKNDYFNYIDEFSQKHKYKIVKFYPELGFISLKYRVNKAKKEETVALSLKQYGNDVYLFMDISKGNTSLEKQIYSLLKPYAQNSYLIKDDLLCRDLSKDAISINTNRKTLSNEDDYNSKVYKISMQRYVGYNKKIYFKDRVKNFFKKIKKREKNKKKSENT